MTCSWAMIRWTKTLMRSVARLPQPVVTATNVSQPTRLSNVCRHFSALSRPVEVLSPMSRPLQVPGTNPVQNQQALKPLLPYNGVFNNTQPCRTKKRGMEYQPSNRKRKTKHGLHARLKTKGGLKMIMRRMLKGRTLLTH